VFLKKASIATNQEEFDFSHPCGPTICISFIAFEKVVWAIEHALNGFKALLPFTFNIAGMDCLPWHMLYNDATSLESFLDNREIWDSWMKDTVTSPKQMYVDPLETMHKLVVDRKNNGSYGIESGGEEP
jgi:hypothetical protein